MSPRERDAAPAPPAAPVLQLVLDASGRASVDGRPLDLPEDTDPQAGLLAAATRCAADLGRPLRVRAVDPAGTWHLVAYPDGEVSELPPEAVEAESHTPGDGDEQDAPDHSDPDDEPWHLRVHPNGIITSVTDAPHSLDEDYVPLHRPDEDPRPADTYPAAPRQANAPFTAPSPAAAPAPEAPPAAEPSDHVEPAASAEPRHEPAPAAEPDPIAEPESATSQEPAPTARTSPALPQSQPDPEPGEEPEPAAPDLVEQLVEPPPLEKATTSEPGADPEVVPVAPPTVSVTAKGDELAAGERIDVTKSTPDAETSAALPIAPTQPAEEWYRLDPPPVSSPPSAAPEPPEVPEQPPPAASTPTTPPAASSEAAPAADPESIPRSESVVPPLPAPADPPDADTTARVPRNDAPQRDRDLPPDAIVHGLRSAAAVPPPRSRRRWIPAAAATALGAVAVTAIVVVATGGGHSALPSSGPGGTAVASGPSAPAGSGASRPGAGPAGAPAVSGPPSLTAVPAALDIGAPPGYSTKPIWALPIASSSSTAVSADGTVVTLTPDRQLAMVDTTSGAVRWHARTPSQASGPYLSRIEGRPVVAMLTTSRLLYWPLTDQGVPTDGTGATEVALPAGAAVTWAGPSPLVTFADGSAGVVRGGTVQRVSLPTRARPLAADGLDVLAVVEADWVRQTAGQGPATPRRLAAPKGATGSSPFRVENVGGGFLGAIWAGSSGPVVAVYDAKNGNKLVEATFPKDVDFAAAPAVREIGSDRTVVGTALFEPSQRNLSILSSSFTPVALAPGHVYANDVSGMVADLQINGKKLDAVRFSARKPTIPVGIVGSGSSRRAVVVVPSGSGWMMCALPTA